MAVKHTHEDLLKACREGDSLGLTVILGAGLPMKGFTLEESPLWALSMGFSSNKELKPYGGYGNHFDNKLDCLALLSDRVDFAEHDYAALKNIHKQTSLYTFRLAKSLPEDIVVKSFTFIPPEEYLEFTARPAFQAFFCDLIDRHVAGEVRFSEELLRKSMRSITNHCGMGDEASSIRMANKLFTNGLGMKLEGEPFESFIPFGPVVLNNYQDLLRIIIDAGELEGVAQHDLGRSVLSMLYTQDNIRRAPEAFEMLLKSLPEADLQGFCGYQAVLDRDEGALAKRVLLEKWQTNKNQARKVAIKL